MLYQLAVKEGAQIRFNTCVTEVDSLAASVTTEYGETIFADVIVGADGYDSRTRQVVTESEDKPPNALDRHVIVTFTIPVHDLESDQDLKPLLNLSEVSISPTHGRKNGEFTETAEWVVEYLARRRVYHECQSLGEYSSPLLFLHAAILMELLI